MEPSDSTGETGETKYQALLELLAGELRKLGLFLDHALWISAGNEPPGMPPIPPESKVAMLMANFDIGDVAFSARTLDPVQYDFDDEFRLMTAGMRSSEAAQVQKDISESLARGENPFA